MSAAVSCSGPCPLCGHADTQWTEVGRFDLPGVRLVNETNAREHWTKRAKRAKAQRHCAKVVAMQFWGAMRWAPLVIVIRRIGPGRMDADNLGASCKHAQDGIADALRVNDNDPRITWRYEQRRGERGEYGVEVEMLGKAGT